MHTSMTVQIQLAPEIKNAALYAQIALERAGKQPDHILDYYFPPMPVWLIESERRGKPQTYLLACKGGTDLYYPSPKLRSGRPVNISGLSLADRKRLLQDLEKITDNPTAP